MNPTIDIGSAQEVAPGVYRDAYGNFGVREEALAPGPVGYGDDAELGYEDDVDDVLAGMDDEEAVAYLEGEIGRAPNARRRARLERRRTRRLQRLGRKGARINDNIDRKLGAGGKGASVNTSGWQETAVAGSYAITAAGAWNIDIRLQHDFVATDIVFEAPTGTTVDSIKFADRQVWSSSTGIPTAFLAGTSNVRNLLKGAQIKGGLDIQISGDHTASTGEVVCMIKGQKPHLSC